MKFLGVDYGLAKIGLAMADDISKLAVPFKIVKETDLVKQIDFLKKIITDEEIDLVVVGLPVSLNQRRTEQTGKTEVFIKKLQTEKLVVVTEDERFTSKVAHNLGIIEDDAVAAMQILQTYLDRN